jgi:hypothetical protein
LLVFDDDDACDDDDDVEEAPVFMVRLKNEDALDELNEEVEDSAANTQDLAAKTARFAALLNMMIQQRVKTLKAQNYDRSKTFFFFLCPF